MRYVTFGARWLRRRAGRTAIHTRRVRKRFQRLESSLRPDVEVKNPERVSIGRGVVISSGTAIVAMVNDLPRLHAFDPSIEIRDGVSIGRFCQITVSNSLVIEEDVLITEGVLITDTVHGYQDVDTPILRQPMQSRGPIRIGRGAWIGNGARIVGRVSIGEQAVVGANAYVDRDVPARCIVAGVPARVVKRYDEVSGAWTRTDEALDARAEPHSDG